MLIIPLFDVKMALYCIDTKKEGYEFLEMLKNQNINFDFEYRHFNYHEFLIKFNNQSDVVLFKLNYGVNFNLSWIKQCTDEVGEFDKLKEHILSDFDIL